MSLFSTVRTIERSYLNYPTGLYPGQHGVLSNAMFNRTTKKRFAMYDIGHDYDYTDAEEWWKDTVPIWTVATKAGTLQI